MSERAGVRFRHFELLRGRMDLRVEGETKRRVNILGKVMPVEDSEVKLPCCVTMKVSSRRDTFA